MKRKVFAVIMAAVILVCGVGLADMPEIDYDSLTQEELVKMREAIDSRIQLVSTGDVVYEKDGYVIKWLGLGNDSQYVYPSMLVTNPNSISVKFRIREIGFNGIQFTVQRVNKSEYVTGPSMTAYVGENFHGFDVELSGMDKLGMTLDSITEVYIDFYFLDAEYNTLLEDTISIAIK